MKTKTKPAPKGAKRSPKGAALVAVGPKGTAFPLSLPAGQGAVDALTLPWGGVREAGGYASLMARHHRGTPCGVAWMDAGAFVAERGQPFSLVPVSALVTVKVACTLNGKTRTLTVLVVKGTDVSPAARVPQYLATHDVPSGRVETRPVREANGELRNESELARGARFVAR